MTPKTTPKMTLLGGFGPFWGPDRASGLVLTRIRGGSMDPWAGPGQDRVEK